MAFELELWVSILGLGFVFGLLGGPCRRREAPLVARLRLIHPSILRLAALRGARRHRAKQARVLL